MYCNFQLMDESVQEVKLGRDLPFSTETKKNKKKN